jgi:hypothetical protein
MDYWGLKITTLMIMVLIMGAFALGMIIKDISHDFEIVFKSGSKVKVWKTMMANVFFLAILGGWLRFFTWFRVISLIVAVPVLGYLAMVGAMNVDRLRGRLFGSRFGKH